MKPNRLTHLLALCGLLAAVPLAAQDGRPPAEPKPRPDGPPEARREAPPPRGEPGPDRREDRPQSRPGPDQPRGERRPDGPPRHEPGRPGGSEHAEHGHADRGHEARTRGHEGRHEPEMRRVTFLGVLTAPVSAEMRSHLGLAEGFGLRVVEVQRGSPAQVAGLKENDVLIRLEDQRLASMDQLQALVRERRKGERVNLRIVSGGKEAMISVELGETALPARPGPVSPSPHFVPPGGGEWPRLPESRLGEMRERLEHHRRALQEWHERMQQWQREPGRGAMPPPPAPGGVERGHGRTSGESAAPVPRRGESHGVSTVTRSDDSGIYTLKREGDRVVFSAQPKDGEARSWNLNQERDRIPEPMREKLRQLEEIRGGRDEGRIRPPAEERKLENGPRDRD